MPPPSGGYGLNPGDGEMLRKVMNDKAVKKSGLLYEWLWAYATARGSGATPEQASLAAYTEWDL